MKKLPVILLLAAVVMSAESFKAPAEQKTVTTSPITAQVGGRSFNLSAENACTVQWNGTGKTAVLSFVGTDIKGKDGYAQSQKINVEYKVNEVGDVLVKGIAYELDGKKFQNIADATSMNVTKFEWSNDKKSFVISAAFDCKAQSSGPFQSNDDAIAIKGNIDNVTVNVSSADVAAGE